MTTVPSLLMRVAVLLTTASWVGVGRGRDRGSRRNSSRAVAKVHRARGRLDDARRLQVAGHVLEQALSAAEQQRRDVDLQLVDEPLAEVLLGDVCAAGDGDVLVARRFAGLRQRG